MHSHTRRKPPRLQRLSHEGALPSRAASGSKLWRRELLSAGSSRCAHDWEEPKQVAQNANTTA